jgi:hypothetical protein
MPYTPEFIQKTIDIWQHYSKEKLTEQDKYGTCQKRTYLNMDLLLLGLATCG